jgi:hypothetical protein
MKYWNIIADNLSAAGWSWGCVSAIDFNGQTNWIADAHRDNGGRFVARADEILTAFIELESVIFACDEICLAKRAGSFPNSAASKDLNQAEDFSPLGSSASSRPAIVERQNDERKISYEKSKHHIHEQR